MRISNVTCPNPSHCSSQAIKQEKERKDMQMGKEEIKLPLVTDEKILHAENSEESRKTVRTNK